MAAQLLGSTVLQWLTLVVCWMALVPGSLGDLMVTLTTTMLPDTLPVFVNGSAPGSAHVYSGGVITQHLKLLALLTLGLHLQADMILVPAVVSRVEHEGRRTVHWRAESPATLWDLPSIDLLLHRHSCKLIAAHTHLPPAGSLMLPSYFLRATDINHAADDVRLFCRRELEANPDLTNLTLVAPELLFALKTRDLPLYREVAAAVKFAQPMVDLADLIVGLMQNHSADGTFNGVQFRLNSQLGEAPLRAELDEYQKRMVEFHFGPVPLYVSSSIFAELMGKGFYVTVGDWLHESAVAKGLASVVLNKHMVLRHHPEALAQLNSLHTEQKTAVDFLVLLKADKVVGSQGSSFGFILREFRNLLHNTSRDTLGIVGDPWWILQEAASFCPP